VDIQNTAFVDETWDLIVCNHILEHVPDYKVALNELKRILKKDGILELTVPTDRNFETVYENENITSKKERIKAFGQYDHVRIFGNDFEKILTDLGFSVEIIDGSKLPAEIVGVIGPANYDDNRVYICKK
jgi:ubiquinone/menaquinone biosynthesis C-methylase UbiE